MFALPPLPAPGSDPHVTGIACPDCSGVLEVEVQGHKGHLHFRCRIRHGYSLPSLLTVKEQILESRLWAVVTACEELATLLGDLDGHAGRQCGTALADSCRSRRAMLQRLAVRLRELIAADRPMVVDFQDGDAEAAGDGEAR